MDLGLDVDWTRVLAPETPWLEILLRGSLTYLALFALLRILLKREAAALGVTDLLVVVLIADAAQNAMADDYHSIADGVLLVAVVVFWAWFLDFLAFHSLTVQRLVIPPKVALVRDGKLLLKNMRRELVTREELATMLREHGIADLAQVRVAYLEPDGQLSVLTVDSEPRPGRRRRRAAA